ncbi:MAG: hypothetical protein H0U76_30210 [Ktedonobacteraceae bacterium]|nr:hypothetical protein [Ktedonobacteraceae bacterium]
MFDQMHVASTHPFLATLLAQPDFQAGLCEGRETFQEGMFEDDHEKAWTEEEIIELVEGEVSGEHYRRERLIDRALGYPSLSYMHHLGFVMSYLNQALAHKEGRQ